MLRLDEAAALETFRRVGVELMFAEIRASLAEFGVHFDTYFNEKDLHDRGELQEALDRLRAQGHVFESDGATWLRTTEFGDDKDRVLRKSDGDWTYFAADCAYYLDKRERGFDRVVIMLGADHHGYIGRMKAMAACFGDDPERNLEILIGQLVNLVRDGEPVRMSKRAGTVVTLEDFVDALGVDAARYALARYLVRLADRHRHRAVDQGEPREPGLLRAVRRGPDRERGPQAADVGLTRGEPDDFHPELLTHEKENDLLKALGEYPAAVARAAELREPHRVARLLEKIAGAYHRFYDEPVPGAAARATSRSATGNRARLWLNDATRTVIANGLGLLGVSAPERM